MPRDRVYKIYFKELDEAGNVVRKSEHGIEYKTPGNARRVAREKYGDNTKYRHTVSWRDPDQEYFSESTCCLCGTVRTRRENPLGGYVTGQRIRISKWDHTLPLDQRYGRGLGLPCGEICDDCYDAIMKTVNDLRKGNPNR